MATDLTIPYCLHPHIYFTLLAPRHCVCNPYDLGHIWVAEIDVQRREVAHISHINNDGNGLEAKSPDNWTRAQPINFTCTPSFYVHCRLLLKLFISMQDYVYLLYLRDNPKKYPGFWLECDIFPLRNDRNTWGWGSGWKSIRNIEIQHSWNF